MIRLNSNLINDFKDLQIDVDSLKENVLNIPMKIMTAGFNIDTIKESGNYGIYNASGTLPNGFSISDNNVLIECFKWSDDWCRQILYDVRVTNGIYTRTLLNGTWTNWVQFVFY